MTLPDVTTDPAASALLDALEHQRDALLGVLSGLSAVQDSIVPGASPGSWFGPAERAQQSAVRDLARVIGEARRAVDRAHGDTATAIWEVRARG